MGEELWGQWEGEIKKGTPTCSSEPLFKVGYNDLLLHYHIHRINKHLVTENPIHRIINRKIERV